LFPCLTGVRQGEKIFYFLFSIFLNDLEDFFRQLDGEPLKIIQEKFENELHIFYNFFVILYADDTVILSEIKEVMQQALDIFECYCEIWRLQVNVAKTKVLILEKEKLHKILILFCMVKRLILLIHTHILG
jgi:hypothetical protein